MKIGIAGCGLVGSTSAYALVIMREAIDALGLN
jgi:hypothetical protein